MVSLQLYCQRIGGDGKERVVEDLRERRGSRERTGGGGTKRVKKTVFRGDPRNFVWGREDGGLTTERKTWVPRKDWRT